ncbi:MAG: NYN domain-containing protein [Clostridiaceae bacterium]|nr:NYN domain-containing protein [Clostridiaceae bacterium]
MKTAVLVDGGFYRKRAYACLGDISPQARADELFTYCLKHLESKQGKSILYRIFYYDCPPVRKKVYHPYLKRTVDFSKTDLFTWTNEFFEALAIKRKMALRLGIINENQAHYQIKNDVLKKLFNGTKNFEEINESDFIFRAEQKGVDMKIGLDISSLSFKKQVNQIVLISGDSDFVSAAKHARREGIDFILDNLGSKIKSELNVHVDGIATKDKRFLWKN